LKGASSSNHARPASFVFTGGVNRYHPLAHADDASVSTRSRAASSVVPTLSEPLFQTRLIISAIGSFFRVAPRLSVVYVISDHVVYSNKSSHKRRGVTERSFELLRPRQAGAVAE